MGILLFRRGLYQQAAAELGAVCRANPEDATALFYRGEALNRLGRVDEAIEALERVTELKPDHSRAFYTLGVLFDKKNAPDRAADMYRRARRLAES
jgi:tetratricopeptide (TPR) repeat protein